MSGPGPVPPSGPGMPPPPPPDEWRGWWGPVQIGPREVYDAVTGLRETVWQLVTSLKETTADVVDHETRLRAVEEHRPGTRLTQLEERVSAIQARLLPLPVLACLFGAASLVVSVVTMKGGK